MWGLIRAVSPMAGVLISADWQWCCDEPKWTHVLNPVIRSGPLVTGCVSVKM